MSTLAPVTTACSRCDLELTFEVAIMVNCDRRADLRQAVLDGTFNRVECASCGHRMSVARTVGFWDWERKQFVVAYPLWAEAHWRDLARVTSEQLIRNLALSAPVGMSAAIEHFTARVVFGYDSLREKFIAWDAGIDDIDVEHAKVGLLTGRPELAGKRVWLWEVTEQTLRFVIATDPVMRQETSRDLLGAPLPEGISSLELRADVFVDHRRFWVQPSPADPLVFDLTGAGYLHAGGAQLREAFDDR